MQRKQANRAIIAARAGVRRNPGTVGTDPARRSPSPSHPMAAGVVRRSRALPMTGAQRNSIGQRSEWNRPVDFFTDPKWAKTVSDGINP